MHHITSERGFTVNSLRRIPGFSFCSAFILAIALFCLSPGGAALAETIIGEICGSNVSLGTVTTVIIDDGTQTLFGSAVIVEGEYDGQTFYGYCIDAHKGVPDECATDIEITQSVAGAACITANYPPVVPADSYDAFVQNTAASVATWTFTDGYTMPPLEEAELSTHWSDEQYFLNEDMGGFPEWTTPEDAYNAVRDASLAIAAECQGATSDPLPSLESLGDQHGNLPTDQTLEVQFQTSEGPNVTLDVSVTGAQLVEPSSGVATTDEDGIVTITVSYTGEQTGTVSVSGPLAAPLGSSVGSIGGNQGFTVDVASLIFFEGRASAQVSWQSPAPTPTPTETTTPTPVPTVATTPTPKPGEEPVTELPETGVAPHQRNDQATILLAATSIILIAGGIALVHRRRLS